jgi:hypothetical protein
MTDVRIIPLSRGMETVVDAEDFERFGDLRWYAHSSGKFYARRTLQVHRRKFHVLLHRLILDAPDGLFVDHINGDSLDNRRANLRLCTHQQNLCNVGPSAQNTTGFKGVVRHPKRPWRFVAHIKDATGKHIHVGTFGDPEAAARAYDTAAKKHHGVFAYQNFPEAA